MGQIIDDMGLYEYAALCYARVFGFAVFPVNGKIPFKGTHGYKDASKDPAVIREMWAEHPDANVAIATGSISGIDVVDIDPRNGGHDAWSSIVDGPLQTPRVTTGSGGTHYYFKHRGTRLPKELAHGIDLLSDGKSIIAPPSIHPCGKPYVWTDHIKDVVLATLPGFVPSVKARKKSNGAALPLPSTREQDLIATLELREKSGRWWGCCPFHEEAEASFSIDFSRSVYYCFGCGKGGSVRRLYHDYTQNLQR